MKIILLGEIETNERNLFKAALEACYENPDIAFVSMDELEITIGREQAVMIPSEFDQLVFSNPVMIEPKCIPITYGPIKKRGKGKIQKW